MGQRADRRSTSGEGTLPQEAFATALAAVPGLGPATLRRCFGLLSPAETWERLTHGGLGRCCPGVPPGVLDGWRRAALDLRPGPAERWEQVVEAGIEVLVLGTPGYPARLVEDPAAPAVLFARGDLGALDPPAVTVVGTRRCTVTGAGIAAELGGALASMGVSVVSGLARGIDSAAHRGALASITDGSGLAAAPVAVVGSGVDVPYPSRNAELWERVATSGLVLSEFAPGTQAERWHFPVRNRVLAGLAQVVVVVESSLSGGSMHTVREAEMRGRTVLAVPGSLRNPVASGTNQLLVDGCAPCLGVDDVVVALALAGCEVPGRDARPSVGSPAGWEGDTSDAELAEVALVLRGDRLTADQVATRVGRAVGPVAGVLQRGVLAGLIIAVGGYFELAQRGDDR